MLLDRRNLLAATVLAGPLATLRQLHAQEKKRRVAVIGHTGRGNYGHDLDTAWLDVPGVELAAVADKNDRGREQARARLKVAEAFADYREMLARIRPEVVSIAPRFLDEHRDMLVACAEAGVKGILIEKPLCRHLQEGDEMLAAARKAAMTVVVAHQTRYSPRVAVARKLLQEGRLGDLLEVRTRGKEDRRGGGEDLMVLGDHLLDAMRFLAGNPEWCFARVTAAGKPITRADVQPGGEGIGPIAGDAMTVTYGLPGGATGFFGSCRARQMPGLRFGLHLFGTRGVLSLATGTLPSAWLLEDPSWTLFDRKGTWQPITSAGVGQPELLKDASLRAGNVLAIADLFRCMESGERPVSSLEDGVAAIEMIMAVYESQRVNGPVAFPLQNRRHPLEMLPGA